VLTLNSRITPPAKPSIIASFFIFKLGNTLWSIDSTFERFNKVNSESATINIAITVMTVFIAFLFTSEVENRSIIVADRDFLKGD